MSASPAPGTEKQRRELSKTSVVASVAATDKRRNVWALELLNRRNAVARWRGQPGCSLHEVAQVLEDSLA